MTSPSTAVTAPAQAPPTPRSDGTFELLYAETRDALYAYVMGLLRDRDAAEDVTAQAWEKAFTSRRRIDPARGEARAWVFTIARNVALDELRRLKRHAAPIGPDHAAQHGAGGDETAAVDARLALQQAMATLSARDRELVALKFYAGLTNREIATVTGQGESNVGTRLSRIVNELRSKL